ncbi:MAG TPA: hypothetical protein VLL52_09875 [Anaerolineae bacterium]|nr:hypothetical protein [Anaerolineae bacterium]
MFDNFINQYRAIFHALTNSPRHFIGAVIGTLNGLFITTDNGVITTIFAILIFSLWGLLLADRIHPPARGRRLLMTGLIVAIVGAFLSWRQDADWLTITRTTINAFFIGAVFGSSPDTAKEGAKQGLIVGFFIALALYGVAYMLNFVVWSISSFFITIITTTLAITFVWSWFKAAEEHLENPITPDDDEALPDKPLILSRRPTSPKNTEEHPPTIPPKTD